MSLWHSPQVAESMKKFAGMIPPTFVFADDGKNGDWGPPPSPAIDAGAVVGLATRTQRAGCVRVYSETANGSATASAEAAANAADQARADPPAANARRAGGASAATARSPTATCTRR